MARDHSTILSWPVNQDKLFGCNRGGKSQKLKESPGLPSK